MKDLGPAKRILGMDIFRYRAKKIITITQSRYLRKVLEKFNMMNCKPTEGSIANILDSQHLNHSKVRKKGNT